MARLRAMGLALLAGAAWTDANAAGLDLTAALGYRHLAEHAAGGERLLTETGMAPSVGFTGRHAAGPGEGFAGADLTRQVLDYEGRSQLGRPVETRSDYRGERLWLGYRLDLGPRWAVVTRWERSFQRREIRAVGAISGLDERTRSDWLAPSVRYRPALPHLAWVEAEWQQSIGGELRVASAGVIDPVTIPLNRRYGLRLSARVPLGAPSARPGLALEPSLAWCRTEASDERTWRRNGRAQGTLNQPRQTEWQAGLSAVLSW
ncbi:MAG: hypothetical protein KDG55_06875 [Rhodocyclaceae bacterium]|nr:hypothetical protein [Rhodocyclaceae bacterium]